MNRKLEFEIEYARMYTRQQKKFPVVQYSITLLVLNVSYSNFIHNLLISKQIICEILKINEPTVIQQYTFENVLSKNQVTNANNVYVLRWH